MKATDLTGEQFGRLKAVSRAGRNPGNGNARWNCECSCGNTTVVDSQNLTKGRTVSCGCAYVKHGKSTSPEYFAWATMIQRCTNEKATGFENYGGRGITVDPAWMDYEQFLKDMGPRPDGKTLDRENNDGPYCKSNCRWATPQEQRANQRERSSARNITLNGKTKTVTEWAVERSLNPKVVFRRLYLGWSEAKALGFENES